MPCSSDQWLMRECEKGHREGSGVPVEWVAALRPGQGRPCQDEARRGGAGRCGAINVKVNMPYRAVKCKGYYNKINNAKISREAAIAKIKSNIRNLCAARCGHIAGSEKGVRRIREWVEEGWGKTLPRARSEVLHATREGIKRNQRGIPLPTWLSVPPPPPHLPQSVDSGSRFSQYFAVFFWAFFSLVSVFSSCCCFSVFFFFFFGVQLVRHERADSPSKHINSYGCRKGAEQSREKGEGRQGVRRVHSLGVDNRARVLDAQVRVASGMWQVDRARQHQSECLPNALVA